MNTNIDFDSIKSIANDNHIIQQSGGATLCPVCAGKLYHFLEPITGGVFWSYPTQKAHFLSNDKPNKKKFGKVFIEDDINHTLVCGLKCNNAIQVRNNPVEAQKILIDILTKHINRDLAIISKQLCSVWSNIGELIIDNKEYECKHNHLHVKFSEYEAENI